MHKTMNFDSTNWLIQKKKRKSSNITNFQDIYTILLFLAMVSSSLIFYFTVMLCPQYFYNKL